jgi:hypothetical protein
MELHDLGEFFRLSAILNLQLSARGVGSRNILSLILGRRSLPEGEKAILLDVLSYLDEAYGTERRKLGPLAVLHPLRATALLARSSEQPLQLDLLTCLLHDKLEDIPFKNTPPADAQRAEEHFLRMLESVDPERKWYLMERVNWLTRQPGDTYYAYIGQLLDHAVQAPSLVRVKLADRLDNTLDMRIDVDDPIRGVDFFATVFRLMFVNGYKGYDPQVEHPDPTPLNGAQRLYQLFKNAVLMSLVRKKVTNLALASMKEAERIVLHIFAYHGIELQDQRALIIDVMRYAQAGGLQHVTPPEAPHDLDGLFLSCFEDSSPEARKVNLDRLYLDKRLMVKSALAFIVIFMSFLDDPSYYVSGIHEGGMNADATPVPQDLAPATAPAGA